MKYKGYLIDLDGTIYLGKEPIPAGKRFVESLQKKGLPYLFVTNNTTRSPEVVAQRLADEFSIHVAPDDLYRKLGNDRFYERPWQRPQSVCDRRSGVDRFDLSCWV